MLSLAFLIALAGGAADTVFADCGRKPSATVEAWVAMRPPRAADTVATAHVCVASKSAATKIASYHGELRFDSTAARVLRVEKLAGGMRAENATKRGEVRFAGAAPDGFAPGPVLTVSLRLARRGVRPALSLRMLELNTAAGESLLPQLVNHSAP